MAVSQAGGEAPAIDLRTTARGVDGLGSQLRRFRGPILSVGLVILVIAMWQLSASLGWVSSIYTSEPSSIAISAWHFVPSQAGLQDMATSGEELLVGFALSIVVGVTLGLLMGRYLILEETVNLSLNIFYSLPLLALAPIIVLWFGIGIESKIVVVFLASLFPILVSTLTGVKNVDSTLKDMARSYRANDVQMWLTVLLPASVPSILSGIRIGMAGALVGVVVGEFISSSSGIGFLISQSANNFNITEMFVGLLVLAVVSLILTIILKNLDTRFSKWRTR
ncbi:MAG TPA: ABC transporter permease [Trebonia sp.]|jgi:NitT/TauT family transport system permease protein